MKTLTSIIIGLVLTIFSYSNNLQVTSATRVQITGDAAGERSGIQFSLSWDNSWMVSGAPSNHDAAWVFVKFRECGDPGATWEHAFLAVTTGAVGNSTAGNHTMGTDLVFAKDILTTDKWGNAGAHNTGAMLRRATVGKGDIAATSITLEITGFTSGTAFDPAAEYDVKVIGIEMVQIPQGAYTVGDGYYVGWSTYRARFNNPVSGGEQMKIENEDELTIQCPRYDGYRSSNANRTLPIDYPKGYDEFYCMKYELTIGQYVDFLNTIDNVCKDQRDNEETTYYQHSYSVAGDIYSTNFPDRAKNYTSIDDLFSYLDWAALRPMTDMEYEKACRGPLTPRQREYVWGSTAGDADMIELKEVTGTVSGQQEPVLNAGKEPNVNHELTQENITGGNFVQGSFYTKMGVIEVGLFARNSVQTRVTTGATYYGVMEMSGNVEELTLMTYYRWETFKGDWGDGNIDATSFRYDVADWPLSGGYFRYKGGAFRDRSTSDFEVSCNYHQESNYGTRSEYRGGRGVR